MPVVKKEGKDTIIFATKEDHATPSKLTLPEPEPSPGLILPNGEINWGCPCLGGMATGPCGVEFREAFSCFHFSKAEPKGSECYEAFKTMQTCMVQYPSIYQKEENNMDLEEPDEQESVEDIGRKDKNKEMALNETVDKVKNAPSEKEIVKAQ